MTQLRQVAASLHFDASPFVDSSVNALTVTTSGSVVQNTTNQKFGAGCMQHFGGSNDSVSFPVTAGGTADICNALQWTVEGWFNFNSLAVPNGSQILWSTCTGGIPANYIRLYLAGSGQLALQLGGGGGGNPGSVNTGTGAITATGTYYHIACVRDYGRLFIYVNGVQLTAFNGYGSLFTGVIGNSGPSIMVGNDYPGSIQGTQFAGGYIDDFRVITGRAVYTAASFTAPTAALPDTLPTQDVYAGALNSTPIYDATVVAGSPGMVSTIDYTSYINTGGITGPNPCLVFLLETYPGTAGVPSVKFGGNTCTVGPIAQGSGTQPTRARMYAVLPVTVGMTFTDSHLVVDYTGVSTTNADCSATATLWYGVDGTTLLTNIAGSPAELQLYSGSSPSDWTASSVLSGNSGDVLLEFGGSYDYTTPTTYPYVKSTQGYSVVNLMQLNGGSFYSAQQARYLTGSVSDTVVWEQNTAAASKYFALLGIRLPYLFPALTISVQPTNQSCATGGTVTFSVTAIQGSPPYSYQWYVNGALITGATASSYTTGPQSNSNTGDQYYVIVTDSAAVSVQSSTVTVTVTGAIGATVDPFWDSVVFGGVFGLALFFSEYTYYPMRPYEDGLDLTPAVPNMIINRYKQGPLETRKRGVDFTLFCETGEVITNVQMTGISPVTTPPLVVNTILIDPNSQQTFAYDVSGGVDGTEYNVQFTVTFNTLQNVTEEVIFYIAVASEEQYP